MPSFKCKDMGMKCVFEVKDESQNELMKVIAVHAANTHDMKTIPADMLEKVKKVIKK